MKPFRQLPAVSRQRGLPAIGFELATDLELEPVGHVVRGSERHNGRTIGEVELEVFAASLVIDRDGVLEAKASSVVGTNALRVRLPGVRGYRAAAVGNAPLPYLYVYAMAAEGALDAGVLITVRSAHPDWPAAAALLMSLRILTRYGVVAANDEQLDDTPIRRTLIE